VKKWFKGHTFLALGILVTPLAVVSGFASAGFGHGSYVAARIALPLACMFSGAYFGAAVVVSLLAFGQWPLYGLLIDKTSHKLRAVACVLAVHALLCCWLFTKGSENFQ
jgi:hypothetical protein